MVPNKYELFCIIKFGTKENITELQKNGTIFMQRLHNYQKIEHDEIGDKNEGLTHLFQANKVKSFKINGKKVEVVKNIKVQASNAYNPFIFCSYALTENSFDDNFNNTIDKKNLNFGDTALLITDINTFYERIEKTLQSNENLYADVVEYIDENIFHGEMGVFKKIDTYKHQNEHRIIIEKDCKDNILKFNIGAIHDISKIYSSKDLLNTLRLVEDNIHQ